MGDACDHPVLLPEPANPRAHHAMIGSDNLAAAMRENPAQYRCVLAPSQLVPNRRVPDRPVIPPSQ
jgi:hypothetical protein